MGQDRAQVLQVEQQQALFVSDAEGDVEHAFLGVVEIEQAGEQQRAHFGDGGADRVALFAEQIPEHGRELFGLVGHAQFVGALDERRLGVARRADAAEIALDVGGKDRNAGPRKALGHDLERHRLAGAGRARHQPVAVGQLQGQQFGLMALADQKSAFGDRQFLGHGAGS